MTDNFYAPPHSIEAEQAVIGGLLLDDDSSERVQKVLAMLKPDSFYSRPHKIIFEEITRMHREQKPVDGLTLFDELERKSLTASVGGFAYIAEIAKNTPSAANIVAYAMQVREAQVIWQSSNVNGLKLQPMRTRNSDGKRKALLFLHMTRQIQGQMLKVMHRVTVR